MNTGVGSDAAMLAVLPAGAFTTVQLNVMSLPPSSWLLLPSMTIGTATMPETSMPASALGMAATDAAHAQSTMSETRATSRAKHTRTHPPCRCSHDRRGYAG